MKLFWKWTAAALAAGICACNFAFPSVSAKTEDSSSNVYLCDEGDFLSDSEFQTAMEELQNAADESGMNVALWIGNTEIGDGSDEDTVAFCDDTYEELYGIDTDGVFLYLDMSGAYSLYDYLSTSGKGQFYYSNGEDYDRVSTMIQDVEEYLERGNEDLPSAIHSFCHNLEYYADRGAPSDKYYTYNKSTGKYLILQDDQVQQVDKLPSEYTSEYTAVFSWGTIIVLAVAVGLIAFLIALLSIRKRYQFKTAGSLQRYLVTNDVQYLERSDQFMRTYTAAAVEAAAAATAVLPAAATAEEVDTDERTDIPSHYCGRRNGLLHHGRGILPFRRRPAPHPGRISPPCLCGNDAFRSVSVRLYLHRR